MESSSFLAEILTEYDEDISGELNIDPLGLLVIWSSYGQNIFRRRIRDALNNSFPGVLRLGYFSDGANLS